MSRENVYTIRMPDGSARQMTARQISEESGIALKLVRRRLSRWFTTWEKLAADPAKAKIEGRQRFLRGTEAIFAEAAEKRAAEAAHREKIESGHPEI